GARKELTRARRLKLHQLHKAIVVLSILQLLLGIMEARQVFLRQINSTGAEIFADVAENVGRLQSQTELDGVFLTGGVAVTENFDADQTDGAGHPITINPQFLERLETLNAQFHLAPGDNF